MVCDQYSQLCSLSGSSDTAFCCQYCNNFILCCVQLAVDWLERSQYFQPYSLGGSSYAASVVAGFLVFCWCSWWLTGWNTAVLTCSTVSTTKLISAATAWELGR